MVEDLLTTHALTVENTWPAPTTFCSDRGFEAWIDVTMTSSHLHPLISSWRVLDTDLGSDHRAILGSIETSAHRTSTSDMKLDWRSVCWDSFRPTRAAQLQRLFLDTLEIIDDADLQRASRLLNEAF